MDYEEAIKMYRLNQKVKTVPDLIRMLRKFYGKMPKEKRKKEADEIIRMLRERERVRQLRRN